LSLYILPDTCVFRFPHNYIRLENYIRRVQQQFISILNIVDISLIHYFQNKITRFYFIFLLGKNMKMTTPLSHTHTKFDRRRHPHQKPLIKLVLEHSLFFVIQFRISLA